MSWDASRREGREAERGKVGRREDRRQEGGMRRGGKVGRR